MTSLAVESVKKLPSGALEPAEIKPVKPFDAAKYLAKLVKNIPPKHPAKPKHITEALASESVRELQRKDHISRRQGELAQHAAFRGWMSKLEEKTRKDTKDASQDANQATKYGMLAKQVVQSMELSQLDGKALH